MQVGSHLFNIEVLAGLHPEHGRNRGELGAEVEPGELGIEKTDVAGGNELIGWAVELEVGVECTSLQGRTVGHVDAQCRKKSFKVLGRHVLGIDLDMQDGGVDGNFKRAVEARNRIADFQRGRFEDSGVFAQIVLGIEIEIDRSASRRASGDEQGFGKLSVAAQMGLAVLRSHAGVEIEQAAESGGGIEKSGAGEIQT